MRLLLSIVSVLAVSTLIVAHFELSSDGIASIPIIILFVVTVVVVLVTKLEFFSQFVFTYLVVWICVGNLNHLAFQALWNDWASDIVTQNRIHVIWLSIVGLAMIVCSSIPTRTRVPRRRRDNMNIAFATSLSLIFACIFAGFVISRIGWGGVYAGNVSDQTRFDIEFPIGISRLPAAFTVATITIMFLTLKRRIGVGIFIGFLIFSYVVLTLQGARWGFFQIVVTAFIALAMTHQLPHLRKYKSLTVTILLVFIAYQPLLAVLRSEDDVLGGLLGNASLVSSFFAWGGEYRDGAASLAQLGSFDIDWISKSYLNTIWVPILPQPISSFLGIDRSISETMTAAHFMQSTYGVATGTIRVGGVLEAYYWSGYVGVSITAILTGFLSNLIDRYSARGDFSMIGIIVWSFAGTTLLYFVASQSNALLPPISALVSILIVIKLTQSLLRVPNSERLDLRNQYALSMSNSSKVQ